MFELDFFILSNSTLKFL